MSSGYRPLLDFMIVGAQKCGTTALFEYLAQHPEIGMSSPKEVHLFDDPNYSSSWTPQQIDECYRPHFPHIPRPTTTPHTRPATPVAASEIPDPTEGGTSNVPRIRGEATPIYLFLPEIAGELKRYNPVLKLIVLLRDPVARAISHYYMEKNRGYENLPLWLALLGEPWRLWRCANPRRHGSAWRRHAYRRRGLYGSQLRNLYRHFDMRQVLLVRSEDLALRHDVALKRIFRFLGVSEMGGIEPKTVFQGDWGGRRHPVVAWLLRIFYWRELVRIKSICRAPAVR